MRHHNANRKFGRVTKQRKALLNSLARSLVLKSKIKTTEPKAKEVRPFVEKLITLGKKNTLSSNRMVIEKVGKDAAKKVLKYAEEYNKRSGGYTSITKTEPRKSDGAKMAIIQFVK